MKGYYLKCLGYYKHKRYNIYINTEEHTIYDGRLPLYTILLEKYKTHTYVMWKVYTNHKWSNDVLDTMLHDTPLVLPKQDYNK